MMQIEQIRPGMTLHSDIHDTSGRLLTKADTVLTKKHIKILKTWGVTQAKIKDDNAQDEAQLPDQNPPSDAEIEQATEIANHLFSQTNRDHPVMQQLLSISVQQIAARLGMERN